jgi:hypothetical protein
MELLERLRGQLDADGMERETKKVPSHLLHDHDRKNEHAKETRKGLVGGGVGCAQTARYGQLHCRCLHEV